MEDIRTVDLTRAQGMMPCVLNGSMLLRQHKDIRVKDVICTVGFNVTEATHRSSYGYD